MPPAFGSIGRPHKGSTVQPGGEGLCLADKVVPGSSNGSRGCVARNVPDENSRRREELARLLDPRRFGSTPVVASTERDPDENACPLSLPAERLLGV